MNITKHQKENILIVDLEGRLDSNTAPALEDELKGNIEGFQELVMNLEKLDYISSAGLRVLLSAHKAMNKQKGSLKIINAGEAIIDVLEVTGFAEIFNIE